MKRVVCFALLSLMAVGLCLSFATDADPEPVTGTSTRSYTFQDVHLTDVLSFPIRGVQTEWRLRFQIRDSEGDVCFFNDAQTNFVNHAEVSLSYTTVKTKADALPAGVKENPQKANFRALRQCIVDLVNLWNPED
jgi:hypothetical protein